MNQPDLFFVGGKSTCSNAIDLLPFQSPGNEAEVMSKYDRAGTGKVILFTVASE